MAIRIRIPRSKNSQGRNPRQPGSPSPRRRSAQRRGWFGKSVAWLLDLKIRYQVLIGLGCVLLLFFLVCASVFSYYYFKYEPIVDARLEKPLFVHTAKIYAAPQEVRVGQKLSASGVADDLRDAGYSDTSSRWHSKVGTFTFRPSGITVYPGPESYHAQQSATITFSNGLVSGITGDQGQQVAAYELEPELITGLSEGAHRTKRRLVTYSELPANMVNAVISIEDRRYFEHGGVDYPRLFGALWADIRAGRPAEGGSTLTMQLARNFFLSPRKKIKRKIIEIAITFQLEHRFTKQQIFQMYANEVPLGEVGSFAITGFGQAAETFFGKSVRQLDLSECALLAGLIQSPSYLNPYRHPARAIRRRNQVLDRMYEYGHITKAQEKAAEAEALKLTPANIDAGEAPYFVDLVRDQLTKRFGDTNFNDDGLRVYTSLDPRLQEAAVAAVHEGMKEVDAIVERRHARLVKRGKKVPLTLPQVALVALNPHTGQVLALVGGRSYGASQLDHALAHRPTGSVFKPFVYAAAFNTSLSGTILSPPVGDTRDTQNVPQTVSTGSQPAPVTPPAGTAGPSSLFTAASLLNNSLTTFDGDYSPGNFDAKYTGLVTAKLALQESLNNATVELAQMVGFDKVAALAREAGITAAQGTPSVALGAYDSTPLQIAGAYTTFANGGVQIDPWMVASIHAADGNVISEYTPKSQDVLDPRVAYLTLSLMENVINHGTGQRIRAMGFTAPAAGKTGTAHDAWFAGFTSNLLCVVWVGNDDYSDLKIQGAHAAAPIWADFMKRAVKLPEYSDVKPFTPPPGIVVVSLDKNTNLLADASCPDDYQAAFLAGTAPIETCDHSNGQRNFFEKIFGAGKHPPSIPARTIALPARPLPPTSSGTNGQPGRVVVEEPGEETPAQKPKKQEKKKGFFGKLFGVFKGDDSQ